MKKEFLIICIISLLLSVGVVCAADNDTSTQGIDENNEVVSSSEWYVNASNIEDGDGSADNPFNNLKSSIDQSKDGDTIYIAPGTYSGSGSNVNLSIDKSLNLINMGSDDVIFDGENTSRIFTVNSTSFNITGLTFTNGMTSEYGGAIYFDNELKNSIINADFIENNALFGGAIYFNDNITNITIMGLFAQNLASSNGGAIIVNGISYYNTFMADFYENRGNGYYGGAIHFRNHCSYNKFYGSFIGNYIKEGSGAGIIFDWDVNNTVFLANFSNNCAYEFPSAAFEVYGNFYNNTVGGYFKNNTESAILILGKCIDNIFNATFINNTAKFDGIFSIGISINNYIACTFINNSGKRGTALNLEYDIINTTIDGVFINNTASDLGGAIAIYPYVDTMNYTVENLTIKGIFINNTATNKGGAIYLKSDFEVLFYASFFENNYAKYGGAAYLETSDVLFNSCILTDNSARKDGGAVYSIKKIKVAGSNFTNNYAKHYGGGIFFLDEGEIINSNFINNTADFYGGGIYFTANGVVDSSNFTQNNVVMDGGGIYFVTYGSVNDSNFKNNVAYDGGAIYTEQCIINNSNFINNTAKENGGAILFAENGTVENSVFTNNSAYNTGGAILSQNLINIDKSSFNFNNAFYAGAVLISGDGIIINSNFTNNNASSGGAIMINGNCNVSNNIFNENVAADGSNDVNLVDNATLKYIVDLKILKSDDISYGDVVKIIVNIICEDKMLDNATVFVIVQNKKYSANSVNGTATIQIPNLNVGSYNVDVVFDGSSNYTDSVKSANFTVSKQKTIITAVNKAYVINYGGKYAVTIKGISGQKVSFNLNGKYIGYATTNANGIATFKLTSKILKSVKSGSKKLVIKLISDNYQASSKTVKITVKKEKTKIVAKKKTFKKSNKVKKYKMILKNSKGKVMKKLSVNMKINGKKYSAKTNSKGKATFKITKLTKIGKYKAKITFKGNKYYNKSTKSVKIRIK